MGTLAQKLAYLGGTKAALRQAINDAGGSISADTPFRQYADWIRDQGATLWLDFVNQNYYSKDAATHYPAGVGFDLITFTRSTGGGITNAQGDCEWLPANTPRIDYDPVTGECLGLLIEEQRARLNTVSAAPSAAQSVSVSAVAQTISFYGAGSVDLTGAHVASLTGAGAYPARRTYTFTPSAGTLTITPTGDVRMLQLEAGAFATSPIIGEGSQVTRATDIASVNELSPWYNPEQGTLFVEADTPQEWIGSRSLLTLRGGDTDRFLVYVAQPRGLQVEEVSNGVRYYTWRSSVPTASRIKLAFTYSDGGVRASLNGDSASTGGAQFDFGGANRVFIGGYNGVIQWGGHIRVIRYYPRAFIDAELQAMTA